MNSVSFPISFFVFSLGEEDEHKGVVLLGDFRIGFLGNFATVFFWIRYRACSRSRVLDL